ncbi:MAG: hypothetical protein AB1753_06910 [Thermoproteota archaeon]
MPSVVIGVRIPFDAMSLPADTLPERAIEYVKGSPGFSALMAGFGEQVFKVSVTVEADHQAP